MKFKEQNLFFDFLVKSGKLPNQLKENIRYDVLSNIYCFGAHNKANLEKPKSELNYIKDYLKNIAKYILVKKQTLLNSTEEISITSSAYFGINKPISKLGYSVSTAPWKLQIDSQYLGNYETFKACNQITTAFRKKDFNTLISNDFIEILEQFKTILKKYYNNTNHKAIFVPQDISFFENISLNIFKELNKPSFLCLHGLPGRYNNADETSDYLLVWGESIKNNYIKAGMDKNKIIVSGHPSYHSKFPQENLRNNTENILILTSSIPAKPSSLYDCNVGDRSNNLYYLYSIQYALKKIGINGVRLRCHPGENSDWYAKHIDMSFFSFDNLPLKNSLEISTLVIGTTSTVCLEALLNGVNYIVYEPLQQNGFALSGYPLYPPFDGSDQRVAWCDNTENLIEIISKGKKTDASLLIDYLNVDKPFDISFLKELIK